ncbi:MAG: DUF3179 domain-containing protein [Verrucomicrobia subdivision 3 bacterium]|nr:DUF3179 domain-containing protein [Limisphaerales bacterium]
MRRSVLVLWVLAGLGVTPRAVHGFDLSSAIIPRNQIVSGGVGRDGIPAIDNPRFISAREANFLRNDDLVVSVSVGDRTRAYPLRILTWHEVVNDQIGNQPIAVTYCPLCGTAMVFNRIINGRTLSFGVSGLLYQSDVLMYDRETESLWSQLAMKAVAGPQVNAALELLVSEHMTWQAWNLKHADGEVLAPPSSSGRNYARNPYAAYEGNPGTVFPVPKHRPELPDKAWVIGIILNGVPKAYLTSQLPPDEPLADSVGGIAVGITYDRIAKQPTVVNSVTGEAVPYVLAYWFAWQAFYRHTELWAGGRE